MRAEDIYQEIILDYSGRKELCREMESPTFAERGHNANCGDDITLLVKLEKDMVKDISYIGNGCAISRASTAMLIELLKGRTITQAKERIAIFFRMMKQEPLTEEEQDQIGDALSLESASRLPARIKCATLSWHTMDIIIEKSHIS